MTKAGKGDMTCMACEFGIRLVDAYLIGCGNPKSDHYCHVLRFLHPCREGVRKMVKVEEKPANVKSGFSPGHIVEQYHSGIRGEEGFGSENSR